RPPGPGRRAEPPGPHGRGQPRGDAHRRSAGGGALIVGAAGVVPGRRCGVHRGHGLVDNAWRCQPHERTEAARCRADGVFPSAGAVCIGAMVWWTTRCVVHPTETPTSLPIAGPTAFFRPPVRCAPGLWFGGQRVALSTLRLARVGRPGSAYSITPQATRAPPPPRGCGWSAWLSPPACTIRARPLMSASFFRRGASTGW